MKGRKVKVRRELFRRKPKGAEQGPEPVQGSLTGALVAGIAMLSPEAETIIIKAGVNMTREQIEAAERELAEKTGKRVAILEPWATAVAVTTEARKDPRPVTSRVKVLEDEANTILPITETAGVNAERLTAELKKRLGVRSPSKDLMEAAKKGLEDGANEVNETWEAGAAAANGATYYFRLPEFVARMRSYLEGQGIEYEVHSALAGEYAGGGKYCIDTVGAYDSATEFYLYLMKEQKTELARREVERRD